MRAPLHARHLLPLLVVALLATLLSAVVAPSARAEGDISRVSGESRVDTSVRLALHGWSNAPEVLISTSRSYPDALAASSLAAMKDAPVLLTEPDELAPVVVAALHQLGTEKVTVLGGRGAVSAGVVDALTELDVEVERLSGDDRFDTAAEITGAAMTESDVVAVALGSRDDDRDAWPDALAAAVLSGLDTPIPTLLVRQDGVPAATADLLELLGPSRILLLGGQSAITSDVAGDLHDLTGATVERVSGDTRYETALTVASFAMDGVGDAGAIDSPKAVFVSGEDFPDALGAGALAAHQGLPLLLVPEDILDDDVDAYLRGDTPITDGLLVGGASAVSDHVLAELGAAVNGDPRPAAPEPPAPPAPACPANSSPDCQYTYSQPISKWERLAQCESGGNWAINTGNGYYGGIQFSLSSWRAVGGTGYPNQNTKWEQIHRGELLLERQGWRAWPACTRKLGYR